MPFFLNTSVVEEIDRAEFVYEALGATMENGVSLADWIRTRRLDACRQELVTSSTGTIIAAVARLRGFSNMSSFSRAFRAEYGLSPSEWRDHCVHRPSR
jgi:transcriptional regulator GlxA family with amidase domain